MPVVKQKQKQSVSQQTKVIVKIGDTKPKRKRAPRKPKIKDMTPAPLKGGGGGAPSLPSAPSQPTIPIYTGSTYQPFELRGFPSVDQYKIAQLPYINNGSGMQLGGDIQNRLLDQRDILAGQIGPNQVQNARNRIPPVPELDFQEANDIDDQPSGRAQIDDITEQIRKLEEEKERRKKGYEKQSETKKKKKEEEKYSDSSLSPQPKPTLKKKLPSEMSEAQLKDKLRDFNRQQKELDSNQVITNIKEMTKQQAQKLVEDLGLY